MMSEDSSAAGTDNRPPMLEENDYDHEDAYDSDVDDEPNAAAAFMAEKKIIYHPLHSKYEFVPQKELSREQAYWLSATNIASLTSDPPKPVTPFVRTSPAKSQVQDQLWYLKAEFSQFDEIIKERTTPHTNYLQVHASVNVVAPISDCMCAELRSSCDREHNRNYVSLQLKFQNYKQCSDTSSASNAIFEINKLRDQLQGKDATIRNLDAQINIMKVLNVGSTKGSCDQQALDTDRIQLKDMITSLRIQLEALSRNVNLKRRYEELSKSNAYSRSTFTAKINALTAENAKLKTELSGKKCSGSIASEKPKVLASGMYTNSSKYVPPPKRANWVKPTPLPKKKQVTFQEPPRTSNRPTQKPPVQQNKKPNVPVNLSTRTKPATESRKRCPKNRATLRTVVSAPSKKCERDGEPAYHNSEHYNTAWRPTGKVDCSPDCKLSDRKAGSKGISGFQGQPVADSIADKIETTTTYGKFKRCIIIPKNIQDSFQDFSSTSEAHQGIPHNTNKIKKHRQLNEEEGTGKREQWRLVYGGKRASNWLERLPTGSISTWEDLTTRFLAQFFPPVRTTKLCNDILIFQQHHGESLSEAWTRFNDLLQKVPHHGIDLWLQVQIFYDHVNPVTRRTIDQSAGGKLCDLNPEESWAILEDLALYDNESYNDPRDFAKLVKEIPSPHDVLMVLTTLRLAWKTLNKPSLNMHPCVPIKREDDRLSRFEANFKQQQSEMTNKIDTVLKAITD
ncbi:zinc finger, CCHC-type containing protein [Tanacetum coccineum]